MRLTIVKKKTGLAFFLMIAAAATGCGILPEQVTEHPDVVVEAVEETNYNLAEVARGDIRLTQKLYFLYSQTEEEQLYFTTEDRRVVGVYADVGDAVEKGQLLAELYSDDLDEELASYQYQKARYELLNAQAGELYAYDRGVLKDSYTAGTLTKSEYEERLDELKEELTQTKEENEDALTIIKLRIEEAEEKLEGCKIYSGIDGVVTYMLPRLEGSTSDKDITAFRIINSDECLFRLEDSAYSGYFEVGQDVYLKVSDSLWYETTVARIEEEADGDTDAETADTGESGSVEESAGSAVVYLEPNEIDTELAVGTRCYYELLLDERTDVLYLPNRCVFVADGQAYVFVEDEGGMMSIRDITIGLQGDSYTEITGGLEEGDIVIRK
jgi:macrolide-specific efflux system membrane fusion protein